MHVSRDVAQRGRAQAPGGSLLGSTPPGKLDDVRRKRLGQGADVQRRRAGLSRPGEQTQRLADERVTQIDLGELRGSVGFGVRYGSPIGPLRLDLGFKLDQRATDPDGRRYALHFSFGQAF